MHAAEHLWRDNRVENPDQIPQADPLFPTRPRDVVEGERFDLNPDNLWPLLNWRPTITITNHSIPVTAGGSVALPPISISTADSDDTLSVKISGLPSYETIKAGDGSLGSSKGGNVTFTVADVASGLTLFSTYKGKSQPQATLTITASNTTAGESPTSAAQTITVTDPPSSSSLDMSDLISPPSSAPVGHAAALFDQFAAAGFNNGRVWWADRLGSRPAQRSREPSVFWPWRPPGINWEAAGEDELPRDQRNVIAPPTNRCRRSPSNASFTRARFMRAIPKQSIATADRA
jgi:hypothetical protein